MELRLFKAKAFRSTHTINVAQVGHDIAAVGTNFNGFSYEAMSGSHHLPNAERMRYVLCHTDAGFLVSFTDRVNILLATPRSKGLIIENYFKEENKGKTMRIMEWLEGEGGREVQKMVG